MTGLCEHTTGLWLLNTNYTTHSQANSVYQLSKIRDIIEYHHRSILSPVKSTWIKEIKNGNFKTFPKLNATQVEKHLSPSTATSKGHIRQVKQNIRSTKQGYPQNK